MCDTQPSVERLCAQLQGHVNFLVRLASTPDLQTMFLISQTSGATFLPETARRLVLEQAARTTQFIEDLPTSSKQQIIIDINQQLGFELDATMRQDKIKKFIENGNLQEPELSTMLYQEIIIVDILRRWIESQPKVKKIDEEELRRQIKSEIEHETIDSITVNEYALVRQQVEEEMYDTIYKEVNKDIGAKYKKKLSQKLKEMHEQMEKELSQQIEARIREEYEQKYKIDEAKYSKSQEKKMYQKIRNQVHSEVEEDFELNVKPQMRQELTKELRKELAPQIRQEVYEQVYEQAKEEVRDEVKGDVKSQLIKKLKPQIREEVEKELKYNIEQQLSKSLTVKLTSQIREELTPVIIEEVKEKLTPQLESKIKQKFTQKYKNLKKKLVMKSNSDYKEAFKLVCLALGDNTLQYSLDTFISCVIKLANEVIQIREELKLQQGSLLAAILDLLLQIQHLDQLHTHTRALMVQQSQIISDLRQQTGSASWVLWAKRILKILNSNITPSDDVHQIRLDIEESIGNLLSRS